VASQERLGSVVLVLVRTMLKIGHEVHACLQLTVQNSATILQCITYVARKYR
jgi:hypothetical protein